MQKAEPPEGQVVTVAARAEQPIIAVVEFAAEELSTAVQSVTLVADFESLIQISVFFT